MTYRIPPVHPALLHGRDKFCPACGRLGEKVRDIRGPFQEWACRHCEPEAFEDMEGDR